MANFPRFLLERPLSAPGGYALPPQEAHHAANVLRLDAGDVVVVFDGQGHYAEATVSAAGKAGVTVDVSDIKTEARLPLALTLATAIPKGKRWQALVEKCTELGVDRIVPVLTERSVARGEGDAGKWRRWVVEAAKQCRRSLLPEVFEPVPLLEAVALAKRENALLLYADPGGEAPIHYQDRLRAVRDAVVMIGPEGGFSDEEMVAFRNAGAMPVRLSPFVLRIETAAAVVCALLREVL